MTRRFMKFAERILPYVSFAGGALNVLFWGLYFSGLIIISKAETGLVTDFESAFPVADAVLGVALLIAGAGLLKRKPYRGFLPYRRGRHGDLPRSSRCDVLRTSWNVPSIDDVNSILTLHQCILHWRRSVWALPRLEILEILQ